MTKDRLLTIATPHIIYDCWPILETQRAYCEARGYEHVVVREAFWKDLHPSFSRVHEIQQALEAGCENVVWADADVAFMEHSWQIADLLGGPYWMAGYCQSNWPPPGSDASKQWQYICAGLTVWRNCPESRAYVDEWANRCVNGSPGILPGSQKVRVTWHPFEQWYFDELNREHSFEGIRAASAEEIGCFSRELWNDGTMWREGMPTVHFAGPNPWPDRRQTYIDHYAKLVRR